MAEFSSDGCSVPALLRLWFPRLVPPETPEQCKACEAHDRDYHAGGTRSQRRMADEMLRRRLILAGMPEWRAGLYWIFVRLFGGPHLHRFTTWAIGRPQAWGWGSGEFRYAEKKWGTG